MDPCPADYHLGHFLYELFCDLVLPWRWRRLRSDPERELQRWREEVREFDAEQPPVWAQPLAPPNPSLPRYGQGSDRSALIEPRAPGGVVQLEVDPEFFGVAYVPRRITGPSEDS